MNERPSFPARPILVALSAWAVLQAATGWLLAAYYRPQPDQALASITEVEYLVRGGAFVRTVHHYGASVIVATTLIYVCTVLWRGGYGREQRWGWWSLLAAAGVLLGLGFTGYLLPWDQRGYWSMRVGTELFGLLPIVGPTAVALLRGGPEYGSATLQRFAMLHTMLLPVLATAALAWHWRAIERRVQGR